MTGWRSALRRARPAAAPPPGDPALAADLAARLDATARVRLGRGLALRHVDGGGCGGCALQLAMLRDTAGALERLGLRFVASPRHADVLLCAGPLTRSMREAVERAYAAMPDPRWVVALGDCAVDGGVFRGSYAVEGGFDAAVPVDLVIRGCPPTPGQILAGLSALLAANATKPTRAPGADGALG
jgi:Ni,Fe-hydrogenase III small subunit